MPSLEQQVELMSNCSKQWTQRNGVNGILVTGRNGGQIFLPAAGYRWGDWRSGIMSNGIYWSSSFCPDVDYDAYGLVFDSGGNWYRCATLRYRGHSVRAVCP